MTTEIDRCVEAFLAERGPGEASVASRPELGRLAGDLNALWWREAERIVLRAAEQAPDRLNFSPEDRLLLDHGLLDFRLLPGGDRHRPALLAEIYAEGLPHQFYLSEWMAERFRQFLLTGGMSPDAGDADSTTKLIRDLRGRLYIRLASLFKDLPGFSPHVLSLFLSGRIDGTLDHMAARLKEAPDERLAEQHRQLFALRARMIARARERARTPDEQALFDALRQVDREAVEHRVSERLARDVAASRALSRDERGAWVLDELKFVKQVLWLGVMGSGLARTYSVLLTAQPRIVKGEIEAILTLARQCDARLTGASAVLIAPYTGGGFYEWDRDTLFLPLVPTREPEQAVLQGLASYRILLDKFQEGGRFKRDYEAALGGGGEDFVRDYRAWVMGVGRGFKGALSPAAFAFFRDRLGPQPADLYAPREWTAHTAQETEELVKSARARAAKEEATFQDLFLLALAAAREQHYLPAIQHLQQALLLSPVDGRALLALAWLTARVGGPASAKPRYADCMALAPGTLWSVYAGDELQKL